MLDGYIRSMRFAVSLFVIAVGAILAFGVADSPDDSVRVHLIGLILIVTGLVGLAMAGQLFVSRRRTDIIYREGGAIEGGGFGIDGMRERARLLGGELTAGPRAGGGFRVAARLPVPVTAP